MQGAMAGALRAVHGWLSGILSVQQSETVPSFVSYPPGGPSLLSAGKAAEGSHLTFAWSLQTAEKEGEVRVEVTRADGVTLSVSGLGDAQLSTGWRCVYWSFADPSEVALGYQYRVRVTVGEDVFEYYPWFVEVTGGGEEGGELSWTVPDPVVKFAEFQPKADKPTKVLTIALAAGGAVLLLLIVALVVVLLRRRGGAAPSQKQEGELEEVDVATQEQGFATQDGGIATQENPMFGTVDGMSEVFEDA
jgi:hypothetical protein